MAGYLAMVRNVPRMTSASVYTPVYDQPLTVVASGATTGQVNGPVTAGTAVTLPNAQTYNSSELSIYLNGVRLEPVFDYTYVGTVPRTQVQFTFSLVVSDVLEFRIERAY